MCGRVVMACDTNLLISLNNNKPIKNGIRYKQSYNVCPTNFLPVYYNKEIEMMKWGVKKDNIYIINARVETMNLYYKDYKKCLILIQGYYEWKNGHTYYFHNNENKIIYLAGLFKQGTDEVSLLFIKFGFEENSVIIITKMATSRVCEIHDRMPIIYDSITEINNTYDDFDTPSFLSFYKVENLVSKLSNDSKDNILPIEEVKYDKNKNLKLTNFFVVKDKSPNKSDLKTEVIKINKNCFENSKFDLIKKLNTDSNKKNDDSDKSTEISFKDKTKYSGKRKNKKEENYLKNFLFSRKKI